MKIYKVKVNGKVYEVELESVSENSEKITENTEKKLDNTPTPTTGEGTVVASPMQGNILKINVAVGDRVKKGQTLMILEAMKLENEIVAPVDVVVKAIKITQGQTVNSKQELLIIG